MATKRAGKAGARVGDGKSTSNGAPARAPRPGLVRVDGRLKKQWEQVLASLNDAERRGASAFDELWEAAAAVVDHNPPLYVFGGYGSAAEFFREVMHEDERNARRLMRVARLASPDEEKKFGTTVLDAAIALVEAQLGHAVDGALPVAFDRMKVPVTRGGRAAKVPLGEATVAEIAAATRAVRKGHGKVTEGGSPARRALVAALSNNAWLKVIRVHEGGGRATFTGVPLESLAEFGRAIAAVKLPADAAKPRRGKAAGK